MNLIQITDIHIDRAGDNPYGVNTVENFRHALQLANTFEYEYMVLTGDLCFRQPDRDTYTWIKSELGEAVKKPYFLVAGNHDNSGEMAEIFDIQDYLQGEELFYTKRMGEWQGIFLDSAAGYLSPYQKEWMREQLNSSHDKFFVFIHHPPVLADVPHMDNQYALEDRDEVMEIMHNSYKTIHVFCGHYHVDKVIAVRNVLIHITPSCYMQIDPRFEKFQVEHYQSGLRLIRCRENYLSSEVHYLR